MLKHTHTHILIQFRPKQQQLLDYTKSEKK